MITIPLRNGGRTIVDDEDGLRLAGYYWRRNATGYAIGVMSLRSNSRRYVMMHRMILGVPETVYVDHRNGDILDNRRENLRPCNKSQNGANIRVVRSQSGYKGVVYIAKLRKWKAQVQVDRVVRYLGLHPTPELAAAAYDEAAIEIWGEFAATNADLGVLRP